jgi:integrase/recombinase XerD
LGNDRQNQVGINEQRKYALDIANLYLGRKNMSKQAKTLSQQELQKVLDYIARNKHSSRNRAMVMTSFLSGMRVGELASLRIKDVVDSEGGIRNQILLTPDMTKGNQARLVFISERLSSELEKYISNISILNSDRKLFYSQKSRSNGFNANTLTQHFHFLYRKAGVDGASSHSGRRTFITNLASKGVSVRVLMSLAGHKHLGTTQRYIDVNDDLLRSAVELV